MTTFMIILNCCKKRVGKVIGTYLLILIISGMSMFLQFYNLDYMSNRYRILRHALLDTIR